MSAPQSVRGWLATPAPLDTKKHGKNAIFSGDNSIVERQQPDYEHFGCVCYTSDHIPLGQVWQTTVLTITSRWRGGLVSGCSCNARGCTCESFLFTLMHHVFDARLM